MRAWLVGIAAAASGCVNIPPFMGGASDAGPDARDGGGGDGADAPPGICAAALGTAGLKTYLPMNEGTGADVFDASSNHNDARLQAGAAWDPNGRVGGAVKFDGVDAYASLGTTAFDQMTPGITVCMWIRPDADVVSAANLVDKSVDGLSGGWNTYLQGDGQIRLGFFTRYRAFAHGSTNLAVGTWYHVCSVWERSAGTGGLALYVDAGLEVQIGPSQGEGTEDSDVAANIRIGHASDLGNQQHGFDGAIDELMIFSRHLDANEIAALHACAP